MVLSDAGLTGGSQEALPRDLATLHTAPGLLAVLLQTWTLVDAGVWLQTPTSTWLQGTETCKRHGPGVRMAWGGREMQEEIKDDSGTKPQKQPSQPGAGKSWSRGNAGRATLDPSCHLLVILGL